MDTLVTKPAYSLVEQSLNSKMSYRHDGSILATNGDGFGIGWYVPERENPGLFKISEPAWANQNISEVCSHIKSHLFMAHIRAASTGAIQRSNTHPFQYENWLFQHNGFLDHIDVLRRDLVFAIAPEYFNCLQGTTDSEILFLLGLTYGLREDPKRAMEQVIAHVEDLCRTRNVPFTLLMSCAISDGHTLYTLRYNSGSAVVRNSQYYSTHADCMKDVQNDKFMLPRHSVVVVSEPLDQHMEHWNDMPRNSFATIRGGAIDITSLQT